MLAEIKRIALKSGTVSDAVGAFALMVTLVAGLHLPVFV
jgi:hypothetical protein